MSGSIGAALLGAIVLVAAMPNAEAQTPERVFRQRCASCHALDQNRFGPALRGVVGRRAGARRGFGYSPALRASGLVWDETLLDRWLQGPSRLAPGARMPARVADANERRLVIEYLRQNP